MNGPDEEDEEYTTRTLERIEACVDRVEDELHEAAVDLRNNAWDIRTWMREVDSRLDALAAAVERLLAAR